MEFDYLALFLSLQHRIPLLRPPTVGDHCPSHFPTYLLFPIINDTVDKYAFICQLSWHSLTFYYPHP